MLVLSGIMRLYVHLLQTGSSDTSLSALACTFSSIDLSRQQVFAGSRPRDQIA